MITTDHALHEQHPLPPFEPSSDVDPLTRILRFLDHAVSTRAKTFAMHFEIHAPRGTGAFQCRRAFDRFLAEFLGDLQRAGYAPSCAWSFAGISQAPLARLLLLLDGTKPTSVAAHLRSAEHGWGVALGIADANGLVGYRDHRDSYGSRIGNGVVLNSGAESVDTDCFRWAGILVDGEAGDPPASPVIGFHGAPSIAPPRD